MRYLLLALCFSGLAACTNEPPPKPQPSDEAGPTYTNRIDVSPQVIENLGITFARAERRHVEQTLRVPGHFESPPAALREYHAMLPGRVELLVAQYDHVEAGTPLFTLESPTWREWQDRMAAAEADVARHRAAVETQRAEREAARQAVSTWPARLAALEQQIAGFEPRGRALAAVTAAREVRVSSLEQAQQRGAVSMDEVRAARVELAEAKAAEVEAANDREALERERADLDAARRIEVAGLPVVDARMAAAQAEVELAAAAFQRLLRSAAGALGVGVEALADDHAWRGMDRVTVTATAAGCVHHIHVTTGAWVEANRGIVHVLDPALLRFRARALQSDIGLLRDGLEVSIVPPQGGSLASRPAARGRLQLGLEGRADARFLDLIVTLDAAPDWARPGITAEAEIVYDRTQEPELAVPLRCVIRDGLELVIFVRDPDDPTKVIRETPLFGPDDGRWIVLYSGVMTGSEVVLDGVYELKLAAGDKPAGGGHFHADGTWHAGDH